MHELAPQLAAPTTIEKVLAGKHNGYVMEPKLDGVRCIIEKLHDQSLRAYTRTGHDLTEKIPHIVDCFNPMAGEFVVDGEIGYFNPLTYIFDFNATMRVVGSAPSTALWKQEEGRADGKEIVFVAFDILNHSGWVVEQPDAHRRKHLEVFMDDLKEASGDSQGLASDALLHTCIRYDAFDERRYNQYVQLGGEGVMLKNPNASYVLGKRRANSWYKLKKFDTADAVIIGATEGQGKYTNQIGALVCKLEDGTEFNCSGMDDSTRMLLSDRFLLGTLVGQWIEVKHFGWTARTPRFPQFLRFREAK